MAFTDEELKLILQKAFQIQKWAILANEYAETGLPACYKNTLTYRLHIVKALNFYDILDRLRYDGKDDYATELKNERDELLAGVGNYSGNIDKNDRFHLPDFGLCDTAHGLFKKLRRIVEDEADDNKKLRLYADHIKDLIRDDVKLYPQIWRGEFGKLLDIVVGRITGYDLFNELLTRISIKNPTAAKQILDSYEHLQKISNDGRNAEDKELKAIITAASNFVLLMRNTANKIAAGDNLPPHLAIDLTRRILTVGTTNIRIKSEKVWDFIKAICSNQRDKIILWNNHPSQWKNAIDTFRRELKKHNCTLKQFIESTKSGRQNGYTLNPNVIIQNGSQVGVRRTKQSK